MPARRLASAGGATGPPVDLSTATPSHGGFTPTDSQPRRRPTNIGWLERIAFRPNSIGPLSFFVEYLIMNLHFGNLRCVDAESGAARRPRRSALGREPVLRFQ